jgi:hypothetical protein
VCGVRATDDNGVELNAKYAVEPDGDHLALVLDSAGGKVTGSPQPRNHQYAAALLLLQVPEVSTRPARITLTGPADVPVPDEPWLDDFDGVSLRPYRKEQGKLRQALLGDRLQAECDLCGYRVPSEFLVAAHIKRRSS